MKVLKKGEWRWQFVCEECKAHLMASEADLVIHKHDAGGGGSSLPACRCSECGTINLPDEALPESVRWRLMNARTIK